MLVRIAQPQPLVADRTRAAVHPADDLAAPSGTNRPGRDELPVAQAALPPGFPAGVAETVGHPPLARAAPDEAEPVSEQQMARRGRERSAGLRVPARPAAKEAQVETYSRRDPQRRRPCPARPGNDGQHGGHRAGPGAAAGPGGGRRPALDRRCREADRQTGADKPECWPARRVRAALAPRPGHRRHPGHCFRNRAGACGGGSPCSAPPGRTARSAVHLALRGASALPAVPGTGSPARSRSLAQGGSPPARTSSCHGPRPAAHQWEPTRVRRDFARAALGLSRR